MKQSKKRSGITNDPKRPDDEQYIVRLIGQVITVSIETVILCRGCRTWTDQCPFSGG